MSMFREIVSHSMITFQEQYIKSGRVLTYEGIFLKYPWSGSSIEDVSKTKKKRCEKYFLEACCFPTMEVREC